MNAVLIDKLLWALFCSKLPFLANSMRLSYKHCEEKAVSKNNSMILNSNNFYGVLHILYYVTGAKEVGFFLHICDLFPESPH